MNVHHLALFNTEQTHLWLAFWCDFFGAILVVATCLFSVAMSEKLGAANVGLAISNSIQVGGGLLAAQYNSCYRHYCTAPLLRMDATCYDFFIRRLCLSVSLWGCADMLAAWLLPCAAGPCVLHMGGARCG